MGHFLAVSVVAFLSLVVPRLSSATEYLVSAVRLHELQSELNKRAAEGYKLVSMTTSSQCRNPSLNTNFECQVLVFLKN